MSKDRGMIKWQPFNSVVNSKEIINSLLKERSKISKPVIFEEEKELIESKIIEAYYMQEKIILTYYQNGNILTVNDYIKKIDQVYKMIYLSNMRLLFNQILSIKLG